MNSAKLRKIILEELSTSGSARPYRRARKLSLTDYLGESSDRYLLELDDDSIISTGARIHEQGLGTFGDADGMGDGDDPEVANSIENPATPAEVTPARTSTPDSSPSVAATPEPPAPAPSTVPDAAATAPPSPGPVGPATVGTTVADDADVEASRVADAADSDSIGDDNDDATELESDPDVAATSDGLGDSIINRLIAGAGEEDARRSSPAGTETGTVLPPSDDATDVSGPEATANITDKKALSRYLDQVDLGKVKISLDESRKLKQKFRG